MLPAAVDVKNDITDGGDGGGDEGEGLILQMPGGGVGRRPVRSVPFIPSSERKRGMGVSEAKDVKSVKDVKGVSTMDLDTMTPAMAANQAVEAVMAAQMALQVGRVDHSYSYSVVMAAQMVLQVGANKA
jgi:hypothetical protein